MRTNGRSFRRALTKSNLAVRGKPRKLLPLRPPLAPVAMMIAAVARKFDPLASSCCLRGVDSVACGLRLLRASRLHPL